MSSKLEIGYIVKIKPIFDQSIYSGKEGVILNKRFIGPDCIYKVEKEFLFLIYKNKTKKI